MADNFKPAQIQKMTLAGSGCTSSATSIILKSFKLPDGSTNVAMTDLGSIAFITLEPATSREEQISFTGITQNADGTATLTGVTRGLRLVSPYDEVSANKFAHAGGAVCVLSNTAGFYDKIAIKSNDETISGTWDFTTLPTVPAASPTTDNQVTRKKYVDDLASTNDALVVHKAGTETITGDKTFTGTGNVFNEKVNYDAHPTFSADTELIDKKYADDLAIAGAPDASTTVKGIVEEATSAEIIAGTAAGATGARLFVNPTHVAETGADKILKTKSTGKIDSSVLPTTADSQVFTASGTWTKPSGATFVEVICIGAGGGGGGGQGAAAGNARGGGCGGGGASWNRKIFRASDLSATETVTVGTSSNAAGGNGAGGSDGAVGGTSSFGTYLYGYGGGGGAGGSGSRSGGSGAGSAGAGVTGGGSSVTGGAPNLGTGIGVAFGGAGVTGTTQTGQTAEYGGASGCGVSSTGAQYPGGGDSLFGGGGGGGAGGVTAATPGTSGAGSPGGAYGAYGTSGNGAAAGAVQGGAGTAGTARSGYGMGDGGGGGAGNNAGTGGAGGDGGAPGGGGGGGGGGTNVGGAGGAGGRGEVRVFSW